MPQLENLKWEQFAREMINAAKHGLSQGAAYSKVYKVAGHAANAAASRLLRNDSIRQRIVELGAGGERKAKLTAADAIEKLDRVYTGALGAEQFSAAGRAAEVQAKVSGLMIERHEIGGVGDFDHLQGTDQIADYWAANMLEEPHYALELLDALRERVLAKIAAGRVEPKVIEASPAPASPRRSEADIALEEFGRRRD